MATDEAIFRAYAEGRVPPTLRFYTWQPPGVSCGRYQDVPREVDLDACRERGYAVVRRPTGGRAVLHQGDLTYAVVIGDRDGLPAGILPAYLHLSRGLLAGLALLGVAADLHAPAGHEGRGNPACFASPSWHELMVGGRKIAGSAQRRESGAVLQHGAVMLSFAPDEQARVLRSPLPGRDLAKILARSAAGLTEFVPGLDASRLAVMLTAGFAEALQVEMVAGTLTAIEERMVAEFRPRYTDEARRWFAESRP